MKNLKKIIIVVIMVSLVVGYYFHLTNRETSTEKETENTEVSKLISRKLEGDYYPEFPREVVNLYSRIVKAYYYTDLTDKEIEGLGAQARQLFDAELLEKNPEEEFYKNLKADIEAYKAVERKIYDFSVEKVADVELFTFEGNEYARVSAAYVVREMGSAVTIYQDYTLRKDEDGKWKILYWEVAKPSNEEYE